MNKFLVVIALLTTIQFTQAQDYKFGKVSKEELQESSNPKDTEANATVLYRKQYVHFDYVQSEGFIQKNEIHERIKIYNKEGFDQATKIVRLYNGSNSLEEDLTKLKAYTYNLEGNKIVEVKLKNDGVFDEATNKYWKTKKFTMPNVKEGSVIEYKYVITSPFLQVGEIDFQQKIPIKKLNFKFSAPEYFVYKKHTNSKATFYPKLIESKGRGEITLTSKSRTGGLGFSDTKTSFNNSTIEFVEHLVSVNEENIPALKSEPMVSNLEIYKAQVLFELDYTNWPNEPIESYATTWERVSKKIYQSQEFGQELKKSNYYKDDIDALLNGVDNPSEKIQLIYNFVKFKVKWNGYNGFYTDEGVKDAYKEQVGNVADINLMLVSMLNYAGLDANPVLVSTRDNGIPLFPTRDGFNYVIGSVQLADGYVLLDATDKYSTINTLPTRALNWQGRLIKKDGSSSWVELNSKKTSKEMRLINATVNPDLSISGKFSNQFTEYQARNYRKKYENSTSDYIAESLQEDFVGLEISNFEVKNLDNLSKPITQSYEFFANNLIEDIGGKLYFPSMLSFASSENPYKSDTRNYPIDFVYPIADKYMVNITVPDGYTVETLPQNTKVQFNDGDSEFTYFAKQNGKILQIITTININKTLVLPTEYQEFKKFYQMFIDKQTEKVVLSKAI